MDYFVSFAMLEIRGTNVRGGREVKEESMKKASPGLPISKSKNELSFWQLFIFLSVFSFFSLS